ncbi:MAG: hypothetical protein AAF744_12785 [Pseudomonadota bacterium]
MTQRDPDEEVLAVLRASPGRRWLGVGSLSFMGVLLVYVAFATPPAALVWQLFLLVVGAGALWAAEMMRRATMSTILLTETGLFDEDGTVIAPVRDIDSIDRGFFAFKPSNGFLLRLKSQSPRQWRPGMWWRLSRRVGVGGMTPGHQAKNMSEIIAIMLARRDGI